MCRTYRCACAPLLPVTGGTCVIVLLLLVLLKSTPCASLHHLSASHGLRMCGACWGTAYSLVHLQEDLLLYRSVVCSTYVAVCGRSRLDLVMACLNMGSDADTLCYLPRVVGQLSCGACELAPAKALCVFLGLVGQAGRHICETWNLPSLTCWWSQTMKCQVQKKTCQVLPVTVTPLFR